LDELIADIDEFDDENEDSAFRQYITSMMQDDKELLKRVIKGSFKESIMIRTNEDKEQERDLKVAAS
jgi:hypothetical protein